MTEHNPQNPNGTTSNPGTQGSTSDLEAAYHGVLYRAEIPPRFKNYTLKSLAGAWEDTPKAGAVEIARAFARHGYGVQRGSERYCLMLAGEFGTGKTTLATAALKELVWQALRVGRKGVEARWLKFYDFVREIQSGYSTGTADEGMQAVQHVPLLMLDDVGDLERGTETDNKRDLLYQVIDHRNDHLRTTILTSNLSEADFAEQFGERTFQRILEMSVMIRMKGANLRLVQPTEAGGSISNGGAA